MHVYRCEKKEEKKQIKKNNDQMLTVWSRNIELKRAHSGLCEH